LFLIEKIILYLKNLFLSTHTHTHTHFVSVSYNFSIFFFNVQELTINSVVNLTGISFRSIERNCSDNNRSKTKRILRWLLSFLFAYRVSSR